MFIPISKFRRRCESQFGTQCLFMIARIAHRLTPGQAYRLGRFLGWVLPRLAKRQLRQVQADVTQVYGGERAPRDIAHLVKQIFYHQGESVIEFFRLPHQTAEEIRRWAPLEGTEHLDAVLARGKGAILLTGHLGNWEVCGTVMGLSRYPTTAIANVQEDESLTELLTSVRKTHGLHVVAMHEIRECIRVLKRNECLGVLGDLNARVPGAFVQFFGYPAATYTGAAYLAYATGASILPLFDERLSDHTHRVRIGPPLALADTGDKQRNLLITTMHCQRVIQDEIRRRPQDWFWQIQRWRTRPEDIPHNEHIPMEHRDLTPEEAAEALRELERVVL